LNYLNKLSLVKLRLVYMAGNSPMQPTLYWLLLLVIVTMIYAGSNVYDSYTAEDNFEYRSLTLKRQEI